MRAHSRDKSGGGIDSLEFRHRKHVLNGDAGGGRDHSLAALYILRELMARLNSERQQAGLPLVKPWELFDLIAATGAGG